MNPPDPEPIDEQLADLRNRIEQAAQQQADETAPERFQQALDREPEAIEKGLDDG